MKKLLLLILILSSASLCGSASDLLAEIPDSISGGQGLSAPVAAEDSMSHAGGPDGALPVMSPSSPALEHYDGPDIESVVFIPKGQWITGVSVSYSQSSQNRYQFLILENLSGDTYSFKVTPMLAYAFANDMAAGGKFGYSRDRTKLDKGSIVLDSETDYSMDNLYRVSHDYYGMAIFRNYFSLGSSKRFGFFYEFQCLLGGGQAKVTKGSGEDLTGAYERNFHFNIGVAPGLAVFLSNYSALEVNVGVLGFDYNHTKQINDRVNVAHYKTKSANFRVNLFSITFGVTFYL